jgi:FHA domain
VTLRLGLTRARICGVSGDELAPEDTPELAAARRCGDPYLVYRDAHARQRVLSLPDTWNRVTIGRGMGADVALTWDPDVSRVQAELSRLADDWTVIDDGLSRNGTFVNDQRVEGRRRVRWRCPALWRDGAVVSLAVPGRGPDTRGSDGPVSARGGPSRRQPAISATSLRRA